MKYNKEKRNNLEQIIARLESGIHDVRELYTDYMSEVEINQSWNTEVEIKNLLKSVKENNKYLEKRK